MCDSAILHPPTAVDVLRNLQRTARRKKQQRNENLRYGAGVAWKQSLATRDSCDDCLRDSRSSDHHSKATKQAARRAYATDAIQQSGEHRSHVQCTAAAYFDGRSRILQV